MTTSGEQLSEENQLDHGTEEFIARVADIRARRASAAEDFRLAGIELDELKEEAALADASRSDREVESQAARDSVLRNSGRLDVTIERLGELAGKE